MSSSLDKAYEKRYGRDFVKKEVVVENKENPALSLISIPFLLIGFLFRLFILGPSKRMENTNGAYHVLNGLVILITHIYFMLNLVEIEQVFSLFFDKETMPIIRGVFAIYCIVQFCRAVLIVGGLNYYGTIVNVDGKGYEMGKRTGNQPRSQNSFDSSSEINSAFSYMNSKMIGMTNAQKESYMSKFFGGKN